MKSKRHSGQGKPVGKRGVKDLAPGKTQNVKGGWSVPVASSEPKAKTTKEIVVTKRVDSASADLF